MKLQCACGAKYEFATSPEMLQNPVKFVCPSCGLDSSAYVNELIRQEFGGVTEPPPPSTQPPPPSSGSSRLKIAHAEPAAEPPAESPDVPRFCPKHPRQQVTETCFVCQKPICPKCMELFGYFCSPLCKNRAEQQNLKAPVYAGRRDLVDARFWRKTGLIFGAIVIVAVLSLGAWTWYAWFGSMPHSYFSVRFADDDRAFAGSSQLAGENQIIFLHGGTLARYDLKSKQKVWSQELITKAELDAVIKRENEAEQQINSGSGYHHWRSANDLQHTAERALQAELQLRVAGKNIWVGKGNELTHYDWDTGKVLNTVHLPERADEMIKKGDELLMVGDQSITHVSLVSGESKVEQFGGTGGVTPASGQNVSSGGLAASDNAKPLDPQQVQSQVQNMTLPARIALPALLANDEYERRLENELNDNSQNSRPKTSSARSLPLETSQIIPGENGFAQFTIRLLEKHFVTRNAMKAPPKQSVLNGNLNANETTDVANETLNEMQRNRGGGTVTVDESRYQVTVHLPGATGTADWTGNVVGPPQLFVLKTVNVITAGKQVIVLDKSNKQLWQASLTYDVPNFGEPADKSQFGDGPCVERGHTLYLFDQAVLTAFDLSSGEARWRLPSIGTVGLFFDDKDDIYVNSTSGNPDDIKYSRQIDVNRKIEAVVFKIDAQTGKTLWSIKPGGFISYLSGKFIYVVQSYDPNPTDQDKTSSDLTDVFQNEAYLRIKRIDPSDGHQLWEYDQGRCPVNIQFDKNSIELIFKREVQVLHYLTL